MVLEPKPVTCRCEDC